MQAGIIVLDELRLSGSIIIKCFFRSTCVPKVHGPAAQGVYFSRCKIHTHIYITKRFYVTGTTYTDSGDVDLDGVSKVADVNMSRRALDFGTESFDNKGSFISTDVDGAGVAGSACSAEKGTALAADDGCGFTPRSSPRLRFLISSNKAEGVCTGFQACMLNSDTRPPSGRSIREGTVKGRILFLFSFTFVSKTRLLFVTECSGTEFSMARSSSALLLKTS